MLEAGDLPPSSAKALKEERWRTPIGLAQGSAVFATSGTDLGFDPLSGDLTMVVGSPPDDATRFDGVDTEAARKSFEEMGFEEDGDFLALGDEGQAITSAVDELGTGPVGINRVAIDGDAIAFGGYEVAVNGALGGSPPLGDEPGFAAAADCLGSDVFAARIVDPDGTATEEVALIAVGLHPPEGDTVPESVCAVGAPNGSIDTAADCMKESFAGAEPLTQQKFSDLIGDFDVETGETDDTPWARASLQPPADRPVGIVFEMLEQGSLSQVLGGFDPAAALGSGTDSAAPAQAAGCGSA
jgi:hypothetical protein